MEKFNVGDYTIHYSQKELEGLPREIFFDFKQSTPFIHQHNFLTLAELNYLYRSALAGYEFRRYATVHDYSDGVTAAKVDTSGRYTHNLNPQQEAFDLLEKILATRMYPLITEHFDVKGTFTRAEGWQFLGYGKDFFFANHCDNSVGGHMSPDPVMHNHTWWSNTPNRKFTALVYLNDQREDYAGSGTYSGGDFVLTRVFKDDVQVAIKPKAGDLLIIPSNFMFSHEVKLVTRGYRFSCVTWIEMLP